MLILFRCTCNSLSPAQRPGLSRDPFATTITSAVSTSLLLRVAIDEEFMVVIFEFAHGLQAYCNVALATANVTYLFPLAFFKLSNQIENKQGLCFLLVALAWLCVVQWRAVLWQLTDWQPCFCEFSYMSRDTSSSRICWRYCQFSYQLEILRVFIIYVGYCEFSYLVDKLRVLISVQWRYCEFSYLSRDTLGSHICWRYCEFSYLLELLQVLILYL